MGLQLVEKLGAEEMTNANVDVAFKETCYKGSKSGLWKKKKKEWTVVIRYNKVLFQ